jgi:hypothetical protein
LKTCDINKLWIVGNYLVGTGFRTGRIKHPCITDLRKRVFAEIRRRKSLKEDIGVTLKEALEIIEEGFSGFGGGISNVSKITKTAANSVATAPARGLGHILKNQVDKYTKPSLSPMDLVHPIKAAKSLAVPVAANALDKKYDIKNKIRAKLGQYNPYGEKGRSFVRDTAKGAMGMPVENVKLTEADIFVLKLLKKAQLLD